MIEEIAPIEFFHYLKSLSSYYYHGLKDNELKLTSNEIICTLTENDIVLIGVKCIDDMNLHLGNETIVLSKTYKLQIDKDQGILLVGDRLAIKYI